MFQIGLTGAQILNQLVVEKVYLYSLH